MIFGKNVILEIVKSWPIIENSELLKWSKCIKLISRKI